MSENTVELRRQIDTAQNLQSVVQTMKAMAAPSINQYERAVEALADYYYAVELGLSVSLQDAAKLPENPDKPWLTATEETSGTHALVFGSDQGMVGRFNDVVVDFALQRLENLTGEVEVWAVGERVHGRLADTGLKVLNHFPVPKTVRGVTPLIGQILVERETPGKDDSKPEFHLFYNRPTSGSVYEPAGQRILPLDRQWREEITSTPWPGTILPDIIGKKREPLGALIREYLFVSLFRACAESLASENASRLAAMQRAERNIEELLKELGGIYNRQRQSSIDEELFDVIAGFEAMSPHSR